MKIKPKMSEISSHSSKLIILVVIDFVVYVLALDVTVTLLMYHSPLTLSCIITIYIPFLFF